MYISFSRKETPRSNVSLEVGRQKMKGGRWASPTFQDGARGRVQQWIESADDFGGRRTRAGDRGEYLYDQIQTKRASRGENVTGDKTTKSIDELARPQEHHDPLKRKLKRV